MRYQSAEVVDQGESLLAPACEARRRNTGGIDAMKKSMKRAAAGMALLVVAALFMLTRQAQAQGPGFLTLEGPGSAIGVTVRETTAEEIKAAKLDQPAGVRIESVRTSSPAEKAGFQAGDIVLEFDGERVRSVRQFTRLVRETPPQRTVTAVIVRGGARQTLQVVPQVSGALSGDVLGLQRRNPLRGFNLDIAPQLRRGRVARPALGVTVTPLSDQLAQYFGVKEGALVTSVESGSPAADAGLRAGDVITTVAGRSVRTPADLSEELRRAQSGEGVEIGVTRDRQSLRLKATLPETRRVTPLGQRGLPA
jgi:serine protease Do